MNFSSTVRFLLWTGALFLNLPSSCSCISIMSLVIMLVSHLVTIMSYRPRYNDISLSHSKCMKQKIVQAHLVCLASHWALNQGDVAAMGHVIFLLL